MTVLHVLVRTCSAGSDSTLAQSDVPIIYITRTLKTSHPCRGQHRLLLGLCAPILVLSMLGFFLLMTDSCCQSAHL